jgi:hypothetical protein
VIPDALKAALKEEGSAAFVTQGPSGPHLVATWNSYIGRAELEIGTPHHLRLKQRFPWSRAAVVLYVSGVEQVLGT